MAENVPPNGDTPGLPYYEKLKRDLRETIHKKRLLDKNVSQLEEEIYRFEGSYLEETTAGNIIKGFDNYIKGASNTGGSTGTGGGTSTRRRGGITDADRIFSRSSASFTRESSPQSSTQTTPSHAPTPTASGNFARDSNPTPTTATSQKGGNTKKHKKAQDEDEEDSDGKPPKRLKITYARGEKGRD